MADFDIIIKDGIVVDGTGAQRYRADVGIRNERIAKIGRLGSASADPRRWRNDRCAGLHRPPHPLRRAAFWDRTVALRVARRHLGRHR